jgi:hypothetical protein
VFRVPPSSDDFRRVEDPYVGRFTYGINGDVPLTDDRLESSDE